MKYTKTIEKFGIISDLFDNEVNSFIVSVQKKQGNILDIQFKITLFHDELNKEMLYTAFIVYEMREQ